MSELSISGLCVLQASTTAYRQHKNEMRLQRYARYPHCCIHTIANNEYTGDTGELLVNIFNTEVKL